MKRTYIYFAKFPFNQSKKYQIQNLQITSFLPSAKHFLIGGGFWWNIFKFKLVSTWANGSTPRPPFCGTDQLVDAKHPAHVFRLVATSANVRMPRSRCWGRRQWETAKHPGCFSQSNDARTSFCRSRPMRWCQASWEVESYHTEYGNVFLLDRICKELVSVRAKVSKLPYWVW